MEENQKEVILLQLKNLVSLLRRGIFQTSSVLCEPDWNMIYRLAKRLLLLGAVADAVRETDCPDEVKLAFEKQGMRILRRQMLFDDARRQIFEEFEREGLSYLPLKGNLFCDLYPKYGMREFSDNDIFVTPFDKEKIDRIFASLGYEISHKNMVDVGYEKPPVLYFEIHQTLFSDDYANLTYFSDFFSRAIRVDRDRNEYRMTDEDAYLYAIAHMYKHDRSGTSLRSYLDIYLLYRSMEGKYDRAYVNEILIRMGLSDFEAKTIDLCERLFSGESCTAADSELDRIGSCGAYGSIEESVRKGIQEDGKTYLWKKVFPSYRFVANQHVSLKRFPFLYPFYLIARPFCILFNKKRRIHAIKKMTVYRTEKKKEK